MADFLKAFEAIDTDFSGEITKDELHAYCERMNFDERFIQKWLNLFDIDNSGTITVEEYCEILGLQPNQDYLDKVNVQRPRTESAAAEGGSEDVDNADSDDVLSGVRIISIDQDMPETLLRRIVRLGREAQEKFSIERDMAKFIKSQLDDHEERAWHVIVGRFQYGSYCTHDIGCMLHFFVLKYAILAWRTPDF